MGARLLGSIGTLGRSDKKHESYFIPGRSWAAISYQQRDHCYGKGMRSLTPVVEFRLLTAFKPHPSLFLLCPQQLIRKPGCSLFCEGEGFTPSKPVPVQELSFWPHSRPQQNLCAGCFVFFLRQLPPPTPPLPEWPALPSSETSVT